MANPMIKLFARANQLGLKNFRQMSEADLTAAIKGAEKGGSLAKGKTTTAVTKGKTKTATAKKTGTASKGKTTPAKGKTTPAKKTAPAKRGSAKTTKATPAKSTARKTASKKTAAQGTKAKRSPARGRKTVQGAARIDNKKIDWRAETNVGKSGKRKDVLDALRRYHGDKLKAFNLLQPKAKVFYKGRNKDEAERLLVWLIGRVAYDFVMNTGQHEPGTRAEWGTSDAQQDIRRRAEREQARKAQRKADRAAGGRKTSTAKKTTTKRQPAKRK